MSDNLGSEQDELYYFAKNFNKLKFSNKAYIESTQKQKLQNEKEIEKLKKEYNKLKSDVETLKKACCYIPGRAKSALTSELTFYKLKYDEARNNKLKSKEAWKKNSEKYNELKAEAKLISDDNNPYVKRIKLLENKLDKAMIKYNEAMSIRRTYEQILTRLKEERAGYDNQIAAIQKSKIAKEHDLAEFKLLLQDSKQAKMYSELLLKNTQLSKEAFEEHFEQLIQSHKRENNKEMMKDKIEEKKKKQKPHENIVTTQEEKMIVNKDEELDKKVKALDEFDKLIKETTGADDINEICQKFSNLRETKDNLHSEQKELEKKTEELKSKKERLVVELSELKYKSQDEITRKEIEENEKNAEKTLNDCERARQKLRKHEKLFIDIENGVNTLINILSHKTFENAFNDKFFQCEESEINLAEVYKELMDDEKEGKVELTKEELNKKISNLNQIFLILEEKCTEIRREHNFDNELNELNKKQQSEIENIYIEQQPESHSDSEYGPEEDIDPELPMKENSKRNEYGSRPYTTAGFRSKRIAISAKNKS